MTNPLPLIVGLAGMATVGKSTVAEALVERLRRNNVPFSVLREAFARPLKEALVTLGVDKTGEPTIYRSLAVTLGMTARGHDQDFFVKRLQNRVGAHISDGPTVFILDDVRFQNERNACHIVYDLIPCGWGEGEWPRLTNEAERLNIHIRELWEANEANREPGGIGRYDYVLRSRAIWHWKDKLEATVATLAHEITKAVSLQTSQSPQTEQSPAQANPSSLPEAGQAAAD